MSDRSSSSPGFEGISGIPLLLADPLIDFPNSSRYQYHRDSNASNYGGANQSNNNTSFSQLSTTVATYLGNLNSSNSTGHNIIEIDDNWYYVDRNHVEVGPVSKNILISLLRINSINLNTLVWHSELNDEYSNPVDNSAAPIDPWVSISEIPLLAMNYHASIEPVQYKPIKTEPNPLFDSALSISTSPCANRTSRLFLKPLTIPHTDSTNSVASLISPGGGIQSSSNSASPSSTLITPRAAQISNELTLQEAATRDFLLVQFKQSEQAYLRQLEIVGTIEIPLLQPILAQLSHNSVQWIAELASITSNTLSLASVFKDHCLFACPAYSADRYSTISSAIDSKQAWEPFLQYIMAFEQLVYTAHSQKSLEKLNAVFQIRKLAAQATNISPSNTSDSSPSSGSSSGGGYSGSQSMIFSDSKQLRQHFAVNSARINENKRKMQTVREDEEEAEQPNTPRKATNHSENKKNNINNSGNSSNTSSAAMSGKKKTSTNQLGYDSYELEEILYSPIHRLEAYHQLIMQLLNSLPSNSNDSLQLKSLQLQLHQLLCWKRHLDNLQSNRIHIKSIELKFIGKPLFFQPSRFLLKEAKFGLINHHSNHSDSPSCKFSISDYTFWLYTDLLVYASKLDSVGYQIHAKIALNLREKGFVAITSIDSPQELMQLLPDFHSQFISIKNEIKAAAYSKFPSLSVINDADLPSESKKSQLKIHNAGTTKTVTYTSSSGHRQRSFTAPDLVSAAQFMPSLQLQNAAETIYSTLASAPMKSVEYFDHTFQEFYAVHHFFSLTIQGRAYFLFTDQASIKNDWLEAIQHFNESSHSTSSIRAGTNNISPTPGLESLSANPSMPASPTLSEHQKCSQCSAKFYVFRKKQTCSHCSSHVCTDCSKGRKIDLSSGSAAPELLGNQVIENLPQRLCEGCYSKFETQLESWSSANPSSVESSSDPLTPPFKIWKEIARESVVQSLSLPNNNSAGSNKSSTTTISTISTRASAASDQSSPHASRANSIMTSPSLGSLEYVVSAPTPGSSISSTNTAASSTILGHNTSLSSNPTGTGSAHSSVSVGITNNLLSTGSSVLSSPFTSPFSGPLRPSQFISPILSSVGRKLTALNESELFLGPEALSSLSPLNLRVPSHVQLEARHGSDHKSTFYCISVNDCAEKEYLLKRFSEFRTFDKQIKQFLKQSRPNIRFNVQLPAQKLFQFKNAELIESRRQVCEVYLQELASLCLNNGYGINSRVGNHGNDVKATTVDVLMHKEIMKFLQGNTLAAILKERRSSTQQ
jgi:hypothetical protein